jgi:hypothetical protein
MDEGVGFAVPTTLGSAARLLGRSALLVDGNGVCGRVGSLVSATALSGSTFNCLTVMGSAALGTVSCSQRYVLRSSVVTCKAIVKAASMCRSAFTRFQRAKSVSPSIDPPSMAIMSNSGSLNSWVISSPPRLQTSSLGAGGSLRAFTAADFLACCCVSAVLGFVCLTRSVYALQEVSSAAAYECVGSEYFRSVGAAVLLCCCTRA